MKESIDRLANGIEVYRAGGNWNSVCFGVALASGSADETDMDAGITHLVEHLCFRRTAKKSQAEIYRRMEELGVDVEGITTNRFVLLSFKARKDAFAGAFDLLWEMLTFADYPEEIVEIEKRVVLSEIREKDYYDDESDVQLNKLWKKYKYTRPVSGYEDSVSAFSAEDVNKRKRELLEGDMKLFVVGDPGKSWDEIKKKFSSLPAKPAKDWAFDDAENDPEPHSGAIKKRRKDALVSLSFTADGLSRTDYRRVVWLKNALCEGAGAAIMAQLREKEGLIYSMDGYAQFAEGQVILTFSYLVDERAVEFSLVRLFEVLRRFQGGEAEKFMPVLRAFYLDNAVFWEEEPREVLMNVFDELDYFGEFVPFSKYREEVSKIDSEGLTWAAKLLFRPENTYLRVAGKLRQGRVGRIFSELFLENCERR